MKRMRLLFLTVLLCVMLFCTAVSAADYAIPGTDMTIGLDDSQWYVFTRENLYDNPQLAQLGIDPQQMESGMLAQSIYFEGLYFQDGVAALELVVAMKPSDKAVNLSNYTDAEIDDLGDRLVKKANSDGYTLYKTAYTYVCMDSVDGEIYLRDYVTVINKQTYTIKFQSMVPFDQEMYSFMDQTVNNVKFDVDYSMKEYEPGFFETVAGRALIGGAVGGLVGGGVAFVTNMKKRKARTQDADQPQKPEQ